MTKNMKKRSNPSKKDLQEAVKIMKEKKAEMPAQIFEETNFCQVGSL